MSGRTLQASGDLNGLIEQARARNIVDYVQSCGIELTRRGREHWALCPFHDEQTPSCAVNAEKGLYHCHGCGAGGDVLDFAMALHHVDFPEAVRMVAGESAPTPAAEPKEPRRLLRTTRYDVPHASEPIVASHVRKDYSDGKKEMWWERDGRSGLQGLPLADLALHGADEIGNADVVLLVEGEKAREAAHELGIPAVGTVTGASGTPGDASLLPLVGKRIVLWPDNDDDGRRHMDRIAERLTALGQPAEKIQVVVWKDAPPKGDVADVIATGASVDDVRALMNAAPQWIASTAASAARVVESKTGASRLVIRTMSGIEPKETDWLWKRWIPRGKLGLLAGLAGDGKSTLLAQIAAIGSVAGPWPDGTPAPLFRTLFMLGEDALDDTLRPRLDLHGANADHVFAIETVLDTDGHHRFFNVEKHLPLLEEAIGDYRIDFLCIDPLTTITPGTDRNAEGDTRDSLTPLVKLADRLNVATFGIAHVGKPSPGNRTAAQRILGATAIHALARVILMTAQGDDDRMVLGVVKSNLAMKPDPLLWTRAEDGPITWHGVSDENVEDLLQGAVSKAPCADAEGFLRELLTAGSMASSDVERQAKTAGISWRTLRRAADDLGVEKWREGGADGHWRWRLPDGQPRYAEPAPTSNLATFPSVAKFPASNLATPIDTEVDKLDTLHNGNLSNGVERGHLHATTPLFEKGGANAEVNIMEGGQLGHMALLGSGQVSPLDHCVDLEPVVAETAANLAALTAEELAQFRAEVDAAAPDDPHIQHDRAALAHFDALHAVGATVAVATPKNLRQRAAGWSS
jgi:putative DNA primase/helicase